MPIDNDINHDLRCIFTVCSGVMTMEDFDLYIVRIWSDSSHYGYNELFDSREADWSGFDFGYLLEVAHKAALLSAIDPNSKLAWVVEQGRQKELTDFYKTAKSMITSRSRQLEAFYDHDEAMRWLSQPN